MKEPLLNALKSSKNNRRLIKKFARTSGLIYLRAKDGNTLADYRTGQQITKIIDIVIQAVREQNISRRYVIDQLEQFNDELSDSGNSYRKILKNFTERLDNEVGGGNCAADNTCDSDSDLRHKNKYK